MTHRHRWLPGSKHKEPVLANPDRLFTFIGGLLAQTQLLDQRGVAVATRIGDVEFALRYALEKGWRVRAYVEEAPMHFDADGVQAPDRHTRTRACDRP